MTNNNELVLDTYIPRINGFLTDFPDIDTEPLQMRTSAGDFYISGRRITVPAQVYNYPPSRDTYEDYVLNIVTSWTGDGVTSTFTAVLPTDSKPILFSTMRVTDGTLLLNDVSTDMLDEESTGYTETYVGTGVFQGDGSGTVNYNTGVVEVTFSTPPAAGLAIEVSFVTLYRISVDTGTTPPVQEPNSTRLQVVHTDETGVMGVEVLARTLWDRPIFLTGRVFQAREANEIISILQEKIKGLGDSVFKNGDLVDGGQLSVGAATTDATGTELIPVTITDGFFYLDGGVRFVPGATVYISGVGKERVGLRIIRSWITEDQDRSLLDISTGWDGSGLPGAYREHLEIQWRANDPAATVVYKFINGAPLDVPVTTEYSRINDVLARRTFIESGNYKVYGFRSSFAPIKYDNTTANSTGTIGVGELTDDTALWLTFDSGLALVQGYEIFKPQATKLRWQKAQGVKASIGAGLIYKPSTATTKEIYELDYKPVASIFNVSAIARTPIMYVTNPGTAEVDLPANSIENGSGLPGSGSYYTGIPNTQAGANVTIFVNSNMSSPKVHGTDFTVSTTGDKITWLTSQPANYYAQWNYDTSQTDFALVKGTRILTKVVGEELDMSRDDFYKKRIVVPLANTDLTKSFRVYTDETGNPPNTEFSYGTDYTIKLGRNATAAGSPLVAKLIWKKKSRRPMFIDSETPGKYYIDYEYWDHTKALHDVPSFLIDIGAPITSLAEGDYLAPDSYFEELPDPLPEDYEGSKIQFPNAPSSDCRNKFYRVVDTVGSIKNSSVEGERESKNRNSLDFRPTGVKTYVGGTARTLASNTQVNYSYSYYTSRADTVRLKKSGRFKIVYGNNGSQTFPGGHSERVLPLVNIYSKPNSKYPRITENTTYRSTMQDLQILKERVNKLEVDFVTSLLEQDAINGASGLTIRGVYTDGFRDFDFTDLEYCQTPLIDIPNNTWASSRYYPYGKTIKAEDVENCYFRCVKSGTSNSSAPAPWNTTAGGITTDGTVHWQAYGHIDRSSAPTQAPSLASASGGTLTTDDYYVKYTWIDSSGESALSQPASVSVSGTGKKITVTISSSGVLASATGVKFYISNDTGANYYLAYPEDAADPVYAIQTADYSNGITVDILSFPTELTVDTLAPVPEIMEDPVCSDAAINNLASSLKFPNNVDAIRSDREWPEDYTATNWYKSVAKSSQLLLLPWKNEVDRTQPKSNRPLQLTAYPYPIHITLDPPADFMVDLEYAPKIETRLPGTTVSNPSAQYTENFGSGDVGDNDSPVHFLPADNPYGRLDGWESMFHMGIPVDTVSVSKSIAPGIQAPMKSDGSAAVDMGYGVDPDLLGAGFMPNYAQVTSSSQFEKVGDVIISGGLTRYIQQREINIVGRGLPPNTPVTVYFDGIQCSWKNPDGTSSSSKTSTSDASSSGTVIGTIIVPPLTPVGKHEITLRAGIHSGTATYVAQGSIERVSSSWASISTVVNDVHDNTTPLAQSFSPKRDAYIAGVRLYFAKVETGSAVNGIEVQIRDMDGGLPGRTVLGQAFRKPGTEISNLTGLNNSTFAVDFYFQDPVYVRGEATYAICLSSVSSNYHVWVGDINAQAIEDNTIVTKRPDVGVMYTSENRRTWSINPKTDLKFNLLYCDFTKQSATVTFPEIDSMVGSSFILGASQLTPPGTQINWYASVNGGTDFFPIRPSLLAIIKDIWRGLIIQAELIGDLEDNQNAALISPAINYRHMGVFAHTPVGEAYGNTAAGQTVAESNYVGETITIDSNIEKLRVVTDEYIDSPYAKVDVYTSSDDGDTWIRMASSSSDGDSSSYSATAMGGVSNVYQVVRDLSIRKASAPSAPSLTLSDDGNNLAGSTAYKVKYTFVTAAGESAPSGASSQSTTSSTQDTITFNLPSGTSFPENSGYSGGAVSLIGVNVYLAVGSGSTTYYRLAEDAYTVDLVAGGAVVIKDDTAFEDEDKLSPPTVDSTQPKKFKIRVHLQAPYKQDLIPDSNSPGSGVTLTAFGQEPFVVETNTDTGSSISNGDYSIVYTWVSQFGETRPSISLNGTTGREYIEVGADQAIDFKFSDNEDYPTYPSVTFPHGATGARVYVRKSDDAGVQHRRIKVQVMRNGSLQEVDTIKATDKYATTNGFRIKTIADQANVANPIYPPNKNTTGAATANAPQVSKLRVIAADEV